MNHCPACEPRWFRHQRDSEPQTKKEKTMKMKTSTLLALGLLTLGATTNLIAQDGPPPEGGPRGPGLGGHRPPPPVIAVLDVNRDGVLDAGEIANASAALLTLDKNGDGQLTQEELRPPRPPCPDGEVNNGGPGGPQ